MKKDNIKNLYEMLYNFNKIAENNNLKYFLIWETLDSIIKYKGIIPHKNKIYVGFLNQDVGKILNVTSLFKKCGYIFRKVKDKSNYKIEKGDVSLDIIIFRKWGKSYKIIDEGEEEKFSINKIAQNHLLPLKKIKIGELSLLVPKNSDKLIKNKNIKGDVIKPGKIKKDKCSVEKILSKTGLMKMIPIEKLDKSNKKWYEPYPYEDCTVQYNGKNTLSFYVNCDVHKKRKKKFLKYLNAAKGVKARREPCVNGKEITNNIVCQLVKQGFVSKYADVNPIEIAIFLSHYNIWVKLLNNKVDQALVFEDDSEIHPKFKSMLNKTLKTLQNKDGKPMIDDVLFLWNGNWNKTAKYGKDIAKVNDKITIFRETRDFTPGTVSYLITRKFARKLVENAFPIRNSVDIYMGEQPFVGKASTALSIKMKYNKVKECYLSPFFTGEDWVCGGEWGTGDTTQNYEADKVDQINCVEIK